MKTKNSKVLLGFIGLVFFILGAALFLQNRELQTLRSLPVAKNEVKNALDEPIAQAPADDVPETKNWKVYKIQAELLAGDGMDQTEIFTTLRDQLADDSELTVFHDDSFKGYGQTPVSLFYLTAKPASIGKKIATENVRLTIIEEQPELLPYLQNGKYCKVDADCSSKQRFCDAGAFNEYRPFVVFGCGSYGSIEGYTDQEIADLNCPLSKATDEPDISADFTTAKCIQNICTAVDMQVTCTKN